MNSNQAKVSVETMKDVMNDKALKTKGDKDRRLREKQQANTKKFMDERKNVQIKQGREKEKLKVTHEKQVTDLDKDIESVSLFLFRFPRLPRNFLTFIIFADCRNVPERTGRVRLVFQDGVLRVILYLYIFF